MLCYYSTVLHAGNDAKIADQVNDETLEHVPYICNNLPTNHNAPWITQEPVENNVTLQHS
jgi:hypothetical protein